MNPAGLEEKTWLPFKVDSSVISSTVDPAGLEKIMWLPFKADSSVTEAFVSDLLVRGLLMSLTWVEAPLLVELWISEVETCLAVRWVFTVFDSCSLVTVMAGLLMVWTVLDNPSGLCVDE